MEFNDLLAQWNGGIFKGAQTRLAKILDVDRGTISRWATGTLVPGEDLRRKVAQTLGVTVDELMATFKAYTMYQRMKADGVMTVKETFKPYETRMRVVGTVSAEKFDFSFDYDTGEYADVDLPRNPGKKAAILRVVGNCMEPKLSNGDMIVVVECTESEIPNGGLAVIRLNGEHTLKRVYRVPDGVELRPDSKAFKTIKIKAGDAADVVGVVRWIIRKP